MSPWLWVAVFIVLTVSIDRFVVRQIPIELSNGEAYKRRRWYTSIFVLGVATVLFNLRLQQGAVDAVSSISQYMLPLLLLGLFLVALSITRSGLPQVSDIGTLSTPTEGASSSLSRNQIRMLALSLLLVIMAIMAAGSKPITLLPAFIPVLLWLTAILLSFAAGWDNPAWGVPRRKTLLIASALFLFALSTRLINSGQIPNPMYGDEGSFGASAVEFISGESNNIFTTSWFQFPSMYFFIQSLPIRLFGNTVFAIRLWSGLVGSLTVVALYFLGRCMFNQRIGVITGLLLAANPLHIEFSRIGLNNIWDALSFTLVLSSLWYAWAHNKRNAFILAGFFLGISQYFYVTGRLLLLLVPLWLLMLAYHKRLKWQQRFFGAATAFVTALPIIWYYLTHLDEYFRVISRVSLWSTGPITDFSLALNSLARGFLGFTHIALTEFYEADEPMLRLWPALFFLLGVLFLFQKRQSLQIGTLGIWLFVLSLAAGLSSSPPAAQRLIAATPAVHLITAYGLMATTEYLQNQWSQIKRTTLILTGILTLLIAAADLRFYFFEHTPQWDNGLTSEVGFRLGQYTQGFPPDSLVVLFSFPRMGFNNLHAMEYLAPQIKGVTMDNAWDSPKNPIIEGAPLIFVFTSEYEDSLKAVQEDYPQGKLLHETYRNDTTVYWLYEVSTPSQ